MIFADKFIFHLALLLRIETGVEMKLNLDDSRKNLEHYKGNNNPHGTQKLLLMPKYTRQYYVWQCGSN